jgi:thiamine biosynthesis lipoprotein ApbE
MTPKLQNYDPCKAFTTYNKVTVLAPDVLVADVFGTVIFNRHVVP